MTLTDRPEANRGAAADIGDRNPAIEEIAANFAFFFPVR
jgi:hypothetical protein